MQNGITQGPWIFQVRINIRVLFRKHSFLSVPRSKSNFAAWETFQIWRQNGTAGKSGIWLHKYNTNVVSLCAVWKAFISDKLSVASEQTNSTGSRMTFLRASVVTGGPLVIPFEIGDELCGSPSCKNHEFSHHSATCVSKWGYTQKGYLGSFQKGNHFHIFKNFLVSLFLRHLSSL